MFTASSSIALENAHCVFEALLSHMREHEVVLEQNADHAFTIHTGDNRIEVAVQDQNLDLRVAATSPSSLHFLKEAAVLHLAELDGSAAETMRWFGEGAAFDRNDARPVNFQLVQFVSRTDLSDGMIRLRLKCGDQFEALWDGGIHVKLMLPKTPGRTPVWPSIAANGTTVWPQGEDALHVRYYTIRRVFPGLREIEVDVVSHPGGAVSDWAQTVSPGAEIGLMGPAGGETPDQNAHVMIIGDQTALPAIYRMLEDLPASVTGHVIGAADGLNELVAYLPETALTLHAIPESAFAEQVVGRADELAREGTPTFAWFAGEYRNAQDLRKLFKRSFGLGKGAQYAFTYWRKGQELDAR
ncbi:siderophore-interacting protein [Roseibium sp. RKSG952]|uniref:siderophore-interacting protein n=1 Tax=Roseibium sp. RKSG952 TaxID=2529384 RepID=UPI0018AD1A31|nr:siderophore-interacting protein [Roseibium sp. RKSG952]